MLETHFQTVIFPIHFQKMIQRDDRKLARVISVQANHYYVQTEEQFYLAQLSGKFFYNTKKEEDMPIVGDYIEIAFQDEKRAIIHKVFERVTLLKRKSPGSSGKVQYLASNIDQIWVAMGLNNDFNIRRLERYLSIIEKSKAKPIVVLTKRDLVDDAEDKKSQISQYFPNVEVCTTSSNLEDGFSELNQFLVPDTTIAIIGSSGVGKSTITNYLLNEDVQKTNETRKDDRGRHTTVSRNLFYSSNHFAIIDMPGMREIQIDDADFSDTFQDIYEYASTCHFRDCTHTNEVGCAVIQAVSDQIIEYSRYENYLKMSNELVERKKFKLRSK
ncbi:MAG: ribosome small subunit-dependent GTPase A [Candidatus Izemoplasmatales bacterium]